MMRKGFKPDKIGQRLKTMTEIRNQNKEVVFEGDKFSLKTPRDIMRQSKRIPK